MREKLRSYTRCGLTNLPFYTDDSPEIAHVHEVKHGGTFVEPNLMKLHKGYHGHFDDHQIVLDPDGQRVWYADHLAHHLSPNPAQYGQLSRNFMKSRWEAVKVQKKCQSDADLYQLLERRSYRCVFVDSAL